MKKGYAIPIYKAELGYKSLEAIRITGKKKRKTKVIDIHHITVEETDDHEESKREINYRI